MDFYLLGADEHQLTFVRALAAPANHRILGWYESREIGDRLTELVPHGRDLGSTATLIDRASADVVVIVGSDDGTDIRHTALRQLAQLGVPMVLRPPSCPAIVAHELDMIVQDTDALMLPIHVDVLQPLVDVVRKWSISPHESPVGRLRQLDLERFSSTSSESDRFDLLVRDALLLRRVLGDFQQVSALSAAASVLPTESRKDVSVQMTSADGVLARWSCSPRDTDMLTIEIVGETARARLVAPANAPWSLELPGGEVRQHEEFDAARALVGEVDSAIALHEPTMRWEDACRATDIAELAYESARRGKTLSVHNERMTEEATFKSLMAAGGCLILLLIPMLLVLMSLLEGLRIPYTKVVAIPLIAGESSWRLPSDARKIVSVTLPNRDGLALSAESLAEVRARRANPEAQHPVAYAFETGLLWLGPPPEEPVTLEVKYEGNFAIWRGWPLVLLLPIAVFLLLQTLKLAFPRRHSVTTRE